MMMTVEPPVVQPSLGLMAFIHGVAGGDRKPEVRESLDRWQQRTPARRASHNVWPGTERIVDQLTE